MNVYSCGQRYNRNNIFVKMEKKKMEIENQRVTKASFKFNNR